MTKEEAFPLGRVSLRHYTKDMWELRDEFSFYWKERDLTITVWERFTTDHASTPSVIPDFIIENTGPISNGATVHDLYYSLLANCEGIPFRCIYKMLSGVYLTKREVDQMFHAANAATGEMNWVQRTLARLVALNFRAKWNWMPKEEWDKQVLKLYE